MAQALATDLAAIPEVHVVSTRDARLPPFQPANCEVAKIGSANEERDAISRLSQAADWMLLIAPESNGILLERVERLASSGVRLLSPPPETVRIATNKQSTADWLARHDVPTPRGSIVNPGERATDGLERAVLKPIDGCGSQEVRLLNPRAAVETAIARLERPMRLEAFIPGLAASVAVVCGPRQHVALPACEQRLSSDGSFTYLGGRTPLPLHLDDRARRLALLAVQSLPGPIVGYLGVDLVLGEAPDGSGDAIIEINPRLTTSYVGLRAACQTNLAAAMLAIAAGQPAHLRFHSESLEFDADGTVRRAVQGGDRT
jgi:predicted ATP-grasp superfamily ATP-dependent carboligase